METFYLTSPNLFFSFFLYIYPQAISSVSLFQHQEDQEYCFILYSFHNLFSFPSTSLSSLFHLFVHSSTSLSSLYHQSVHSSIFILSSFIFIFYLPFHICSMLQSMVFCLDGRFLQKTFSIDHQTSHSVFALKYYFQGYLQTFFCFWIINLLFFCFSS